jgi:hypothetical protein
VLAAALLGAVQWTTGAGAALLVGIGGRTSPTSMAIVVLAFSVAALAVMTVLVRVQPGSAWSDPDGELAAVETG